MASHTTFRVFLADSPLQLDTGFLNAVGLALGKELLRLVEVGPPKLPNVFPSVDGKSSAFMACHSLIHKPKPISQDCPACCSSLKHPEVSWVLDLAVWPCWCPAIRSGTHEVCIGLVVLLLGAGCLEVSDSQQRTALERLRIGCPDVPTARVIFKTSWHVVALPLCLFLCPFVCLCLLVSCLFLCLSSWSLCLCLSLSIFSSPPRLQITYCVQDVSR